MGNLSVLQKAEPGSLIVIENALPDDLYQELAETFPHSNPRGRNNTISAKSCTRFINKTNIWGKFVRYHTSEQFLSEVERVSGLTFPRPVGKRGGTGKVKMECQCIATSPVTEVSIVKKPHYDNLATKWAGILYFRDPEDNAGGNLQFYKVDNPEFGLKRMCLNYGEPYLTIPYQPNIFVGWVNNKTAIHGVTPRQPTYIERRYVNFVVDQ